MSTITKKKQPKNQLTLLHRRMLRYRDVKECDSFNVSQAVIRCLKRNEVFQQPSMKGLDCPALFERLAQWFAIGIGVVLGIFDYLEDKRD